MPPPNLQQGYALLLFILTLFMATSVSVYYGILPQANQLKHLQTQHHMALLNQVKTNLLLYATSTPEIYATNTNGNFYTAELIAAPGYLPCPDTNKDGTSDTPCGGSELLSIVSGLLPQAIATRHFRFIDDTPLDVWFVVDSRYVIQNVNYHNATIKRYSPINSHSPGNGNIKLGKQDNLVALVFISNKTPAEHLLDPSQNLFHQLNSPMITISHAEWNRNIESRARSEKNAYCQLDSVIKNWFNINWRGILC